MHSEDLTFGRVIIEALASLESSSRAAVLIRHSIRGPITPENPDVSLTEEGRAHARIFGESLPWNGSLLVRTSSMRRCVETAEEILRGYRESHPDSTAALLQSGKSLAALLHSDENKSQIRELVKLMERRAPEPDSEWDIPSERVDSALAAARRTVRDLRALLGGVPEGSLCLFVDHDFHIMILGEALFGGYLTKKQWIDYLDGLVLTVGPEDELIAVRGSQKVVVSSSDGQ